MSDLFIHLRCTQSTSHLVHEALIHKGNPDQIGGSIGFGQPIAVGLRVRTIPVFLVGLQNLPVKQILQDSGSALLGQESVQIPM